MSMKKLFSLALVAVMAISVFAQVQVTKADLTAKKMKMEHKTVAKQIDAKTLDFTPAGVFGQAPVKKAKKAYAAASADTAFYAGENGLVYYGGSYENGYQTYPILFQPYSRDVEFINYSVFAGAEQFGWFLGENQVGADTNLIVPAGTFEGPAQYIETAPTFLMESGESYTYGEGNTSENWPYTWMAFPDFKMPMTKCQMYTTPKAKYGNGDGTNQFLWSWTETSYIYGTGLDLTGYGIGSGPIDSLAIYWGIEGMTTTFDTIVIPVASFGASTVEIGTNLTVTILDANGVVARTPITAANLMNVETSANGSFGCIVIPGEHTINGEFMILISGVSTGGANLCLYADGAEDSGSGETFHVINGYIYDFFGMNINVTLYAQIDETGAQGIEKTDVAKKAVKVVRDGQLIIKRGDKEFNVLGAQL